MRRSWLFLLIIIFHISELNCCWRDVSVARTQSLSQDTKWMIRVVWDVFRHDTDRTGGSAASWLVALKNAWASKWKQLLGVLLTPLFFSVSDVPQDPTFFMCSWCVSELFLEGNTKQLVSWVGGVCSCMTSPPGTKLSYMNMNRFSAAIQNTCSAACCLDAFCFY